MRMILFLLLLTITPLFAQSEDPLQQEYQEQSGTAIHILFDDSGSMSGEKLNQAKAAFQTWIGSLPDGLKFSLSTLNQGQILETKNYPKTEVENAVRNIQVNGGTPLIRSIQKIGKSILERRKTVTPYERHIVVIFTDGEATDGNAQEVRMIVNELSKHTIESVGIGFHGQGEYLKGATTQYYNANDQNGLVTALQNVVSEIDQQSEVVISPEVAELMANPIETPSADETQLQESPPDQSSFPVLLVLIGVIALAAFVLVLLRTL